MGSFYHISRKQLLKVYEPRNIPRHIFLAARLHEQILSMTVYPCQVKMVNFTSFARAIFLSRETYQGKIL